MLHSPITGSGNVRLVRQFSSSYIVGIYGKRLSIEVTRFFTGIEEIALYECCDTGYLFFYPFSVTGDAGLYQELQQIPWYYSKSRLEHAEAVRAIAEQHKVLEVGCGDGFFLKKLRDKEVDAVGLEMNPGAINKALSEKLSVVNETIEEHATGHAGSYDVVVSFQVLEHIPKVKPFLDACLRVLKPGGLLIISVPNNDAAYHKHADDPLNMPPHHMGRWGVNSLIALQSFYPAKLARMVTDANTPPEWLGDYAMKKTERRLRDRFGWPGLLIARVSEAFIKFGAQTTLDLIPGQTITAFFNKDKER
jgi:2-polyprenyl-3-methyl-5-hydroxy-6-metoxy-1,4-benzoquinol methylase